MIKKYALIIGASGDIGLDVAKKLAKSGWSLYLHYNNSNVKINELLEELTKQYSSQEFIKIKSDLSKDNVEKIVDEVFSIDALIFAQGITEYNFFSSLSKEKIAELIQVNYQQPLLLVKSLESKLAKSKQGRIVFIGSIYGKIGSAMEVLYSSLKGALSSFVNAYAKEVASLGITVNVVAPGAVNTQMIKDFSEEELTELKEEIPMGRLAKPTDISFWIDVLLKPQAQYMTGETIYVDGGWLA